VLELRRLPLRLLRRRLPHSAPSCLKRAALRFPQMEDGARQLASCDGDSHPPPT
jgi:hypothetical protein